VAEVRTVAVETVVVVATAVVVVVIDHGHQNFFIYRTRI
jgi:hypothetical protein